MNKKFMKIVSSCVMAAVLAFTGAVQAAETADTEFEADLGIEDYAESIKNIYKMDYPEQAEIIDKVVDTISSSDEFIRIFESEGKSAFQIIEDSLRDMLNPTAVPLIQTDDLYVSKYSFAQLVPIDGYIDCGSAVTVMALMGSGVYEYTTNTSTTNGYQRNVAKELYDGSSTQTNITDITKVLRDKVQSGNDYKFVTKVFTDLSNSYNQVFNTLANSLVEDAVPVIKIEDTTKLPYYQYHTPQSKIESQYLVVDSIDFNAETIRVVDPNCYYNINNYSQTSAHTLSYSEFKDLVTSAESGTFWVSAYVSDVNAKNFSLLLEKYPNGSYFTKDGNACTCHSWCEWYSNCNCIKYDDSSQCVAFARYVFYSLKGYKYTSGTTTTLNLRNATATTLKNKLKDVSIGTYIYGEVSGGYPHALAIIEASESGITTWEANYNANYHCRVRYKTWTWGEFAAYMTYIKIIIQ